MLTELVHESQLLNVFERALPSADIRSFIEVYREKKKEYAGIPVRYLPNVAFSILFNLEKEIHILHNGQQYIFTFPVLIPSTYTWTATGQYFEIRFSLGPLPFLINNPSKTIFESPVSLAGLVCEEFINSMKAARHFEERKDLSDNYFQRLYAKNSELVNKYQVVEEMLDFFMEKAESGFKLERDLKLSYVSSKSLQRYFIKNFGASPKAVYCILRMRKALTSYFNEGRPFRLYDFDYYDYSHFYKEIKKLSGLKLQELKS